MTNTSHEELPLLAVAAPASPKTAPPLVPPRIEGVLLVATAALLSSILSAFVKYASYSMPSMETVFWRSFVAWLLTLVALRVNKVSLRVARPCWPALAARCGFGACSMSLYYYGMKQLVLADASVLLATSPVMTFFLGALVLHERIDIITLGFALFSFVGVTCVSRPTFLFGLPSDAATAKTDSMVAVLGTLLSAVLAACVYVSMRRLQQLPVLVVIHYFSLTATLVSLVPLLVQGTFVLDLSLATWCAVLGSGSLGFLSQICLTRGFQLEKAGVAAVLTYLDVVFVFIWDFAFLHERINAWSVLGAGIVGGCASMIVLRRMHHP